MEFGDFGRFGNFSRRPLQGAHTVYGEQADEPARAWFGVREQHVGTLIPRVDITPAARELLALLEAQHGPLMFHQLGEGKLGEGDSIRGPLCMPRGAFRIDAHDVLLGWLNGTPFFVPAAEFGRWQDAQLTVDVAPGRGSVSSVETLRDMHFLLHIRSCLQHELPLLQPIDFGPRDFPHHPSWDSSEKGRT